MSTNQPLAVP